jgi:hypothetical protein
MAFLPTDISGCKLWLRADSLGLSNGAAVSSWSDESGNSSHATQVTSTKQPIFTTNVINGLPVVRFDITDDFMLTADLAGAPLAQPNTIFIVASLPNTRTILDGKTTAGRARVNSNGTVVRMNGGTSVDTTGVTSGTTLRIYSVFFNTTNSGMYINGTSVLSAANTGSNSLTALHLGCDASETAFFGGDLAEVIVYAGALSSADREVVETYLSQKYAISVPNRRAYASPVAYTQSVLSENARQDHFTSATPLTFALTLKDSTGFYNRLAAASPLSFALNLNSVSARIDHYAAAAPISYALTLQNATGLYDRIAIADPVSFSLNINNANPAATYRAEALPVSYSLSINPAGGRRYGVTILSPTKLWPGRQIFNGALGNLTFVSNSQIDLDTRHFNGNLTQAIASAGSSPARIQCWGIVSISADTISGANILLDVMPGCTISSSVAHSLTINGTLRAAPVAWVGSNLTVYFTQPSYPIIPEWFGYKPDAVTINDAVTTAGVAQLSSAARPSATDDIGKIVFVYGAGSLSSHSGLNNALRTTDEIQSLAISATSGSFKLTFSGQTTASIAYNASASAVATALIALSNIGPFDVWVTGGPLATAPVIVQFTGQLAGSNVAQMTGDATNGGSGGLAGGSASVSISTVQGGAASVSVTGRSGNDYVLSAKAGATVSGAYAAIGTDNTSALQKCFNSLLNGGLVVFGPGLAVCGSVTLPSKVKCTGVPGATIFFCTSNTCFSFSNKDNVTIDGLGFDATGNLGSGGSVSLVGGTTMHDIQIISTRFIDTFLTNGVAPVSTFSRQALLLRDYQHVRVDRCYFENIRTKLGGGAGNVYDCIVSNSYFKNMNENGVSFLESSSTGITEKVIVDNCIFDGIMESGGAILFGDDNAGISQTTLDFTVSNCKFTGVLPDNTSFIQNRGSFLQQNIAFLNNQFHLGGVSGNNAMGINQAIQTASGNPIKNFLMLGNEFYGAWDLASARIADIDSGRIEGNTLRQDTVLGRGFQLSSMGQGVTIANNTFTGFGTSIDLLEGLDNVIIRHNEIILAAINSAVGIIVNAYTTPEKFFLIENTIVGSGGSYTNNYGIRDVNAGNGNSDDIQYVRNKITNIDLTPVLGSHYYKDLPDHAFVINAEEPDILILPAGSATPSVRGSRTAMATNSSATTVTDLLNGYKGQLLTVLFTDSNTTLQHGSNFKLAGGVDFVSTADDSITLVYQGAHWQEVSRSLNS